MDLYTLDRQFLPQDPIDQFVSAIWTERYSVCGDTQLVVPATPENLEKLADGTFLALRGSKEVMIIQTQSIENGLMTIVGKTMDEFLDQRTVWYKSLYYNETSAPEKVIDYTPNETIYPPDGMVTPGRFIADVVDKMCIHPPPDYTDTVFNTINLNWMFEIIPGLSLGAVDTTGTAKRMTIPIGPLYTGISKIANDEGLGISLYLESASPVTGYSLKFKVYRGVDHTTGGAGPLVRLVPELDSIQNLKELRSIQQFKNVVYVYYKGIVYERLLNPDDPEPVGFDRRVLVVDAAGEPVGRKVVTSYAGGSYTQIIVGPDEILAFIEQNAKDALANHNYIQAIDGESSPASEYQYGKDYGLGDIIELQGLTGAISKARITEYIRSQDKTGEKAYPTISVIDSDKSP